MSVGGPSGADLAADGAELAGRDPAVLRTEIRVTREGEDQPSMVVEATRAREDEW